MRWAWLGGLSLTTAVAVSCIASAPEGIRRQTDTGNGGGGEGFGLSSSTGGGTPSGSTATDPHAVLGATPPHGPFTGGQHVVVHGQGFTPAARVWFGDDEADGVVVIDPTRVQVSAPPHAPGMVDVSCQNGDDASTHRTLAAAYEYDPLYAEPDTGPVAGGTVIAIHGSATGWDGASDIEARVDQKPCTTVHLLGPDVIECTVPKGTPGTKSVSVTADDDSVTAADAYTYQDSADGFKGGLGGAPLAGTLKVLVFDNYTGDPLAGAHVVVGSDLDTGLYLQAGPSGMALFQDPSLTDPVTVTVAAKCHSPISFVAVPVDSVTAYLDPTLTPQCAGDGDPPPVGGSPVTMGEVVGELVWPGGQEFQKGKWVNIPAVTSADEERVAYVMFATTNPQRTFYLPSSSNAVYETSPGDLGYGFDVSAYPGNQSAYALAGIRDKVTGSFTAYAFGATKGVAVFPGQTTKDVVITMGHSQDQALTLQVLPPGPGPKGPDRLQATVAVEIGQARYAILPSMQKTPLLPVAGPILFVGLPPLDGSLTGARYLAGASAVTGPQLGAPMSVVGMVATTTTSQPVLIDGFVRLPALLAPAPGGAFDGRHLAVSYAEGGFPPDLTVYEIVAGGGVARWLVAVPQASHSITLPDLDGFESAALPHGPLVVNVYGARIDDFDYGKLRYANLRATGMDAYSLDFFNAHF